MSTLPFATEFLVAVVFAGLFGGLISGLLGVGGGIVIVPVLYHILSVLEVEQSIRMQVAVATSLATIVFTSLASLRSHRKRDAIDVDLLRSWSLPIFFGVVAGSLLGGSVNGLLLTGVFGTVAVAVAIRMIMRTESSKTTNGFPNRATKVISGLAVGFLSALMGIGGGTLSVPLLTTFGYDIRRAVGTASAIGFVISIPGTLGYVATGWRVPGLPPYSIGFVNWAAALSLIPLTMAMAPVGAKLAHSIPRRALQICFAVFLLATAVKMFQDLYRAF